MPSSPVSPHPVPRLRPRPLLLLLVLLSTPACADRGAGATYVDRVTDPDGVPVVQNGSVPQQWDGRLPRLELEPVAVIGQEEGPEEQLISRPWLPFAVGPDGRLGYVEERPTELRIYDGGGNFLFRAGRYGEGPGEFRWVSIIQHLDGVGWALYCGRFRMVIYDDQGRLVETLSTQNLPGSAFNRMYIGADGLLWYWHDDPMEWGTNHSRLIRADWRAMTADTLVQVEHTRLVADSNIGWQTYQPQSLAVDAAGRAWVNYALDYQMVVYEPGDGSCWRVRREHEPVPDPAHRDPASDENWAYVVMDNKRIHARPPECFPAIAYLQWASDDELWAFSGAFIDSPLVQVDVFSPDGIYRRAFQAEQDLGRARIRDGHVWWLRENEAGVPQFVRYRLRLTPDPDRGG